MSLGLLFRLLWGARAALATQSQGLLRGDEGEISRRNYWRPKQALAKYKELVGVKHD